MKGKQTTVTVLGVLLILSMVLSACGGGAVVEPTKAPAAAAPTEAPKAAEPTQAPAAAAPTEAPKAAEATAAPAAAAAGVALAKSPSEVKVAIIPGGPHPYFAPMPDGLAAAVKDYGLSAQSEFKAPAEWKLDAQNQLINSMVAQGFNAFGIFPGDANATNATVDELVAKGIPVIATAGCLKDPTKSTFCLATDVGQSAYLGTKAAHRSDGRQGQPDPWHRLPRRPEHPDPHQGRREGGRRDQRRRQTPADPGRHRQPGNRRQGHQLLPGGPRQRDRRHRDLGLRALHGRRHRPGQPRRQAHQDGRHRRRPDRPRRHQERLPDRHHGSEPLRPGLYHRPGAELPEAGLHQEG